MCVYVWAKEIAKELKTCHETKNSDNRRKCIWILDEFFDIKLWVSKHVSFCTHTAVYIYSVTYALSFAWLASSAATLVEFWLQSLGWIMLLAAKIVYYNFMCWNCVCAQQFCHSFPNAASFISTYYMQSMISAMLFIGAQRCNIKFSC